MAGISRKGEMFLNAFVSIGAAVVIFGAWQKILHKSLADLFLTIGLLVEAGIFLVYGILSFYGYGLDDHKSHGGDSKGGRQQMPQVSLAQGGIIPQLPADQVANLQKNLHQILEVARQMRDLSLAVKASQQFSQELSKAAGAFSAVGGMVKDTAISIDGFKRVADQLGSMGGQTKQLAQNMTVLNQIYQSEIENTSKGMKNMTTLYANIGQVAESLKEGVKEANDVKKEIAGLAQNLTQLNSVYSSILSAMKK